MNNDQGVSITLIEEMESGPQSWSLFWTAILESLSEIHFGDQCTGHM